MRKLIGKELRLALHPTCWIFLLLSAMVLIPNYPYYVIFFYTGLGVFFTCLEGRENSDVLYTMLLPVSRKQLVGARICVVVLLELVQMGLTVLLSLLRAALPLGENAAGMEANLALFGLGFVMLGLGHLVFFGIYYKNVQHVGPAFLGSSAVTFFYIAVAETLAHTVPFFRDRLDTPDPAFLPEKLTVLVLGMLLYGLMTYLSYRRSAKAFAAQDI